MFVEYDKWKSKKTPYQENTLDKDLELLSKLPVSVKTEDDGAGRIRSVIEVQSEKGMRTVDFWHSNGYWKLRRMRGEGFGIDKLAIFFKFVKKEKK